MALPGPLGPEDLANVPAKRGVFLLEGPAGQPILLATAADIRSRMRGRLAPPEEEAPASRRADLREIATRLRWRLTTGHFETDWQYLELARLIYPDRYRRMLAFAPARFVHVRTDEAFATFARVRQVPATGRCFGPFATSRACGRFIEILQDVFDLCRCEQLFTGGGAGCIYAQMGQCIAPCRREDALPVYADMIDRACRCAAGERDEIARQLQQAMRQAAGDREYELAARCKQRLERLAELDQPAFAHAAAAERFQYVLIQPGGGRRKLKAFLFDRGAIRGRLLDYPPAPRQLASLLSATAKFSSGARAIGQPEQERIALVAQLLFTSPARRGVAVRYGPALTAQELARRIEAGAGVLGVARAKRPQTGEGSAPK